MKRWSDLSTDDRDAIRSDLADAITTCSRLRMLFRDDERRNHIARRARQWLVEIEEGIDGDEK